jgi:murein DD-endopeptidase MepM/ murein hydrolase activator NlpD
MSDEPHRDPDLPVTPQGPGDAPEGEANGGSAARLPPKTAAPADVEGPSVVPSEATAADAPQSDALKDDATKSGDAQPSHPVGAALPVPVVAMVAAEPEPASDGAKVAEGDESDDVVAAAPSPPPESPPPESPDAPSALSSDALVLANPPRSAGDASRLVPRRSAAAMSLPVLCALLFMGTAIGVSRAPGTVSTLAPPSSASVSLASSGGIAGLALPDADVETDAGTSDAAPPFEPVWRVARGKDDATLAHHEGTVGKRSLTQALLRAGLGKADVAHIQKAFEGVRRFEHPGPKDTFAFLKAKGDGRVTAFEYAESPSEVWQAREVDGKLAGHKLELHIERKAVRAALVVTDGVESACAKAGYGDDLAHALDEALDGHMDLSDVKRGARVRVVAIEEKVEGTLVHYPRVDAVEYQPPKGSKLRVYFHERPVEEGRRRHRERTGNNGHTGAGHYDERGQRPYRGIWRAPIPFARVTSRYNPRRLHPVLKVVMPHNGVDFGASTGTPVRASAPGTVKSVGDSGPCGNMVAIDHAAGLTSAYCHLSRFASGIHPGQHIEARQLVGYVGQTGRATGPHLHFAVKRGDQFIDPLAMKLDGVHALPAADRATFQARRAELDKELDAIPLPGLVPGDDAGDGESDDEIKDAVDADAAAP